MKAIAINGGPRKQWNTATLLEKALEGAGKMDYGHCLGLISGFLARTFGSCETLLSYDTLQFSDYSRYVAPRFDPALKARRRSEVFPQDCRKAFKLGRRLV